MVFDQAEKRYQVFTSLLQMMTPPGADQPSPEEKIAVQLTILETLVSRDPPNHCAQRLTRELGACEEPHGEDTTVRG